MASTSARRLGFFGVALLLVLAASCRRADKQYYPVQGKVFVDGKPAEGALVVFHPGAETDDSGMRALRPAARVNADGSFALRSYDPLVCPTPRDGAPAGEYLIAINWFPEGAVETGAEVIPDKLHNRYGDPATSGLRAAVKEQANQLPPFELTAKKKP